MKGFDQNSNEPVGRMINQVRSAVKAVPVGSTAAHLIEILGEPDRKSSTVKTDLSADARQQVSSGVLGNILASTVLTERPDHDEIWTYVNPYRPSISHHFALKDSVVVRTWEFRANA